MTEYKSQKRNNSNGEDKEKIEKGVTPGPMPSITPNESNEREDENEAEE